MTDVRDTCQTLELYAYSCVGLISYYRLGVFAQHWWPSDCHTGVLRKSLSIGMVWYTKLRWTPAQQYATCGIRSTNHTSNVFAQHWWPSDCGICVLRKSLSIGMVNVIFLEIRIYSRLWGVCVLWVVCGIVSRKFHIGNLDEYISNIQIFGAHARSGDIYVYHSIVSSRMGLWIDPKLCRLVCSMYIGAPHANLRI